MIAASSDRLTAGRRLAAMCILVVLIAPPSWGASAPLTPWGVAPQTYAGSTHPDSVQANLAMAENLGHRPLAIAAAWRGLHAVSTGDPRGACGYWELAAELDPAYPSATLAPLRFTFPREPRRAAEALLAFPGSLICGFEAQQTTAANLFILILFPLLLASSACCLLIFLRHASHLHHLLWEYFQGLLPHAVAKWTVWGILLLPLFWNLGFLLWSLLLVAAALPMLTRVERRLAIGAAALLIITPLAMDTLATVTAPGDPTHPAAAMARAQRTGRSELALAEIQAVAARVPAEGPLYFTEALLARQTGDLPRARRALQRASAYRPLPEHRFDSARGILAYREGNVEAAIRYLTQAARHAPDRFSVRYNLSKAYARASLFLKADREMRHAFRLDAARVRFEERRRLSDQANDLIEERLSSTDLWRYTTRRHRGEGFGLPAGLTLIYPGHNPKLLWIGILLLPAAAYTTTRWHRRLRIHACSQCGKTVCRRCLRRREKRVFCDECALTAGRWATAQYTQLLLTKVLGRHDRFRDRLLDVARVVLPGVGAMLRGRVTTAFVQLFVASFALLWLGCRGLPLKPVPWTRLDDMLLPATLLGVLALAVLQAWVVFAEIRGLRKRTHLKAFLGAARQAPSRSRVA